MDQGDLIFVLCLACIGLSILCFRVSFRARQRIERVMRANQVYRAWLKPFAEDWDDPSMDVYNEQPHT